MKFEFVKDFETCVICDRDIRKNERCEDRCCPLCHDRFCGKETIENAREIVAEENAQL
jgi:hypothetical protein